MINVGVIEQAIMEAVAVWWSGLCDINWISLGGKLRSLYNNFPKKIKNDVQRTSLWGKSVGKSLQYVSQPLEEN